MQTRNVFRPLLAITVLLAGGCGGGEHPYGKLQDPPLVHARLHVVTLVSDAAAVDEQIRQAGYTLLSLPPNYPQADAVQAAIWGVPEPGAAKARHYKAVKAGAPDLRLVVMSLAARGRKSNDATERAFFRNVLGTDPPAWPLPNGPSDNVRVQAWTYFIPDVLAANRRLRDNGIPVIYDPVAITTAYLGDHKTLAIRAPDGTVVQLVQSTTQ
jgi:hypothetical protein